MPRSLLALYAVRVARGTALRRARIGWVGLLVVVLGLHVAWAWADDAWDPFQLGDRLFAQVREMHLVFAVLLGPAWAAGTSAVSEEERDLWRMTGRGGRWAVIVPVLGLLVLDAGFVPLAAWVDTEGRAAWDLASALLFPAGLLVVHGALAVRLALSGFRMTAAAVWTIVAGSVAWVAIPAWLAGTWDLSLVDPATSPLTAALGDPWGLMGAPGEPRGALALVPLAAASTALLLPSPLEKAPRWPWIAAIGLGVGGGWWWLVQVGLLAVAATLQPVGFPRISLASRPSGGTVRPRRVGRWRTFLGIRVRRALRGTVGMWTATAVFLAAFLLWWRMPGNFLRTQEIPLGLYFLAVGLAAGAMAAVDVEIDVSDHRDGMRLAGAPRGIEAIAGVVGAWARAAPWLAAGAWLTGHSLGWTIVFAWAEVACVRAALRRGASLPAVVLATFVFGVVVSVMGGVPALDAVRMLLVPVLVDAPVPWDVEAMSAAGWAIVAVIGTTLSRPPP